MEALRGAILNKDKPIIPFVILGFASLASVYQVVMSWGEYRFKGKDVSALDLVLAACFLIFLVYQTWKYSQSLFRSPIAALLIISVMYDAWLYLSHTWAVVNFSQLAIEAGWVCAVAILYFDTIAITPREASEQ